MNKHVLSAKVRKVFGRKVKALRRSGVVPGNVFGKKSKSVALELEHKSLIKVMREAGETGLIDLAVEGEKGTRPVLVAAYAQDPVSGSLLHVDLHEVDLTVKTKANVPIRVIGESSAVTAGNVLVQQKNEIEVEALPADLPDHIEADITSLTEVGMSILAKDLKVDRSKVTLEIPDEEMIVTVQEPAKEEAVAPPAPAAGEAPVEGEATAESESKPGSTDNKSGGPEEKKSDDKKSESKAEK